MNLSSVRSYLDSMGKPLSSEAEKLLTNMEQMQAVCLWSLCAQSGIRKKMCCSSSSLSIYVLHTELFKSRPQARNVQAQQQLASAERSRSSSFGSTHSTQRKCSAGSDSSILAGAISRARQLDEEEINGNYKL